MKRRRLEVWSSAHAGAQRAAEDRVDREKDPSCPLHVAHADLATRAQGLWVSDGQG